MPLPSFRSWLDNRVQEPSQADRLAFLIAQAGAAGVSLGRLRRLCGLPPETLADVLRALTATGQVRMLKVGGQMTYRTTM
jgi:predicted transcriptional regulator